MRGGNSLRRSLEVEYWVVDRTGRLVEPDGLVDAAPGVEREFVEPLLEIKTSPCESTAELSGELLGRLEAVLDRAAALDRRLVPLATPVNCGEIRDLPEERTRIQQVVVGGDFEYVRHCAGTHVHVEQQPGATVDQLNALIAADPALALVNSSPYFDGESLAAGARSQLYRRLAYGDIAHQGRLWPYVESVDAWNRRLERRYGEFVTAAVGAGIDPDTVEEHFDPESAVWTPVQLRETFGTVEWRSPDTALPSQILRLADSLVDLVDLAVRSEVRVDGERGRAGDPLLLPEFGAVTEYLDAAIDRGLAAPAVRSYLDRLGFDPAAYDPLSTAVSGRGPVSRPEARELRLEAADRLERDLDRARAVAGDA